MLFGTVEVSVHYIDLLQSCILNQSSHILSEHALLRKLCFKHLIISLNSNLVNTCQCVYFQVHLPTGSVVTVHESYGKFLNVWMWAAGTEFGQTLGES